MPRGPLMNRPFVEEEAGLHRSSCRGRPLRAQAQLGLLPLVTCVLTSWPWAAGAGPTSGGTSVANCPSQSPLSGSLWHSVGDCCKRPEGTGTFTLGSLQPGG